MPAPDGDATPDVTTQHRVPMDELRRVMHCVARFVGGREDEASGHVLLAVEGGRRVWYAVDDTLMVRLAGGDGPAATPVAIPGRLLVVPFDHDDDVELVVSPAATAGGRRALRLTWGGMAATMPAGPDGFPDVRGIVQDVMDRPFVDATGEVRLLNHLVEQARWSPRGVEVGRDVPVPAFWLHVGDGRLGVEVGWEKYGRTELSIDVDVDGAVHLSVNPRLFDELLEHLEGPTFTLHLPARLNDPVWATDGEWSMYLLPMQPYPPLEDIRDELERLLRRGFRLERLVADDDGDYPFAVGDTAMYVRLVDAAPPVVQVFGIVLDGTECTDELLRELNDLNARVHHAKVFWVDGQVLAEAELIASALDLDELIAACQAVSHVLELRPMLAASFGEGSPRPSAQDG